MIQALLFDLDDTLIPSSRLYDEALLACGVDPQGAAYLAARARVKGRLDEGSPSCHNRALYFQEMAQSQARFSAAQALDLLERYEATLEGLLAESWAALGRDALIARLAARYRLCLVSNETARTQLRKLRALDPHGQLFEALIVSEAVGADKPAPPIFEEALRQLGLPASACAMIGDSVPGDLLPARALGMQVFHSVEFVGDDSAETPGIARLAALAELEARLAALPGTEQ